MSGTVLSQSPARSVRHFAVRSTWGRFFQQKKTMIYITISQKTINNNYRQLIIIETVNMYKLYHNI